MNKTISRKPFFETVTSKVKFSMFDTVRISVSISTRNYYNSLKNIREVAVIIVNFATL